MTCGDSIQIQRKSTKQKQSEHGPLKKKSLENRKDNSVSFGQDSQRVVLRKEAKSFFISQFCM